AMKYKEDDTGLLVIAGKDYGMGSSRDWAAKGTNLLGIKTVIAESYERIHRSNLVMMGVLPLQFEAGQNAEKLGLTGKETFTVHIDENVKPHDLLKVTAVDQNGKTTEFNMIARSDSDVEVDDSRHVGVLQTVYSKRLQASTTHSSWEPPELDPFRMYFFSINVFYLNGTHFTFTNPAKIHTITYRK